MTNSLLQLGRVLRQHYEKAALALAVLALAAVGLFMTRQTDGTKKAIQAMTTHLDQMRTNSAPYVRTNLAPHWTSLERATNLVRLDLGPPQPLFSPKR